MTSTLIRKRTSIALVSFLALAIMGLPSAAGAAAGDLDPSFGSGGKVVTDLGDFDEGQAVILQPNGKIVVGGSATGDFALTRYTPDGSLDPVFDGDGTVTTDFGRLDWVRGLAFRPGYLVAAGTSADLPPSGHFAVARYRLDGSLDPTFDGDGKVEVNFGRAPPEAAISPSSPTARSLSSAGSIPRTATPTSPLSASTRTAAPTRASGQVGSSSPISEAPTTGRRLSRSRAMVESSSPAEPEIFPLRLRGGALRTEWHA